MNATACHLVFATLQQHFKGMSELNLRDCLIYLDDIIVFSSTFEEHLEKLQAAFSHLA